MYENSSVHLKNGVVVGYSNSSTNLRVRILPSGPIDAVPTAFGAGSNQNEVLALQGTPTGIRGDTWYYDLSSVTFRNGIVSGYSNTSKNLKIRE